MKTKVRRNKAIWEVIYPDGSISIVDSRESRITMYNCMLRNDRKVTKSEHIKNKEVFGVIECDDIVVTESGMWTEIGEEIGYSGKNKPFWYDYSNINLDNTEEIMLTTIGKRIYRV